MRQFEQLDLMLTDQDGMLQISQATAVRDFKISIL